MKISDGAYGKEKVASTSNWSNMYELKLKTWKEPIQRKEDMNFIVKYNNLNQLKMFTLSNIYYNQINTPNLLK